MNLSQPHLPSKLVARMEDSPFTSDDQLVKDVANVCRGCGRSLFDPMLPYTVMPRARESR